VAEEKTQAKGFARYVTEAATKVGLVLNSPAGDGRARLAEEAKVPEADMAKVLAGQYEVPIDLLGPLAKALGVEQKELLRAAGVLEGRAEQRNGPLSPRVAAQRLGIKSPQNVNAFEVLVRVLVEAEKRRR
jgi:hypothetical protein